ncbi:MAG: response regulator [Alphaproteobacteria bacterium]|nr:response regulator [Alphaproteobacteria bacterium]
MSDKKTVLVIDDEKDLVELIKDNLELENYHVLTAANGLEGLDVLKQKSPHLIILDMNMPKMNGIEFYRRLSQDSEGHTEHPVLVLTARANLRELFRDIGADGFMSKPFEIPDLIKEARLIIEKRWAEKPDKAKQKKTTGPKKILILDHDKNASSRMMSKFAEIGHAPTLVVTGTEGIEKAKVMQPDIILIDLNLQDISGDTVASRLKKLAATSEIPIILYTSNFQSNDRSLLLRIVEHAGVKHFVDNNDPSSIISECNHVLGME